jgi:cob(I)alamin adenosyltransferase
VDTLEREVHCIETSPGILNDWSIPGELAGSAPFEVARTVCRRAERPAVGLFEAREQTNPHIFAYLNRLSDLLRLLGRLLELQAGANTALRSIDYRGNKWTRAW